jgi:predicted transcriptional regulator
VQQHISGIPVVESGGRVLGILSEADILFKERRAPNQRGFFASLLDIGLPDMHEKLEARTVGEAMTAPAVTIEPSRPVTDAASTMLERRLKRLPVVDHAGRLIGIVTRADLVRAFVRSDEEIAREIREDVLRMSLWLAPDAVTVTVERGEVRLVGEVETKADAELIPTFVQRVPGVVSVLSKLNWPDENGRKGGLTPSRRTPRDSARIPFARDRRRHGSTQRRGTPPDRRVLAGSELPLDRPDLPAR